MSLSPLPDTVRTTISSGLKDILLNAPKAWADSPSRRWNWRTQEISDTFPLESTGGQSFEDSHTE